MTQCLFSSSLGSDHTRYWEKAYIYGIYGLIYYKYRHFRPQMQPYTCCALNVSVEEYNEDSECKGPWWLPLSKFIRRKSCYKLDSCKLCWATPIKLFKIAIITSFSTNLYIFYVSTKSFGFTVGLNVILNYIVKSFTGLRPKEG